MPAGQNAHALGGTKYDPTEHVLAQATDREVENDPSAQLAHVVEADAALLAE